MTDKTQIAARLRLAERVEDSPPLGTSIRLRELTRAQWRACVEAARPPGNDTGLLVDPWNIGLLATSAIDADGAPLFTREEIMEWPNRTAVWDEVARLAQIVLDLSEVGDTPLKSGDPAINAE